MNTNKLSTKVNTEPVRNINELAQEFGVTAKRLGGIVGSDETAPGRYRWQ